MLRVNEKEIYEYHIINQLCIQMMWISDVLNYKELVT